MLDIRATAYISPVAEVDFASVPLSVHLANFADETGLVTGQFRIYNSTTGSLIHTSEIVPLSLSAGQSVNVTALTDFDPPAPADDTYFVVFNGNASNALVPDGIGIFLGAFHFDVKPAPLGPIPAGHHVTHEDTGIDEIDVTGLAGLLGDAQTPILHHLEHEDGGSDEIYVAGLAGELADDQPPLQHDASKHTETTPQTLTDQAAIDWDLALGGAAQVTLGDNRTLNAPTNMINGARYRLKAIQDGTGTRLLTWNAIYRFPGGVHPCLSAAPNNIDILQFDCDGTIMDCVGMVNALA